MLQSLRAARAIAGERAFQPPARTPRRFDPRPIMVLIGFVGLCLLVATADAVLTEPGMRGWYPALRHPPGTPPNWLFPVVWIPLYVAMGIAAWRIWRRTPNGQSRIAGFGSLTQRAALRRRGLLLWAWQLAFNAIWTPVFFGLHRPVPALAIIVALALLIALTLHDFGRIDRIATLLMTPYLVWVCYACWLNAGIAWLNPG